MAAADLDLGPFRPQERDRWAELWAGYHLFYGRPSVAPELYDLAWRRLRGGPPFHGVGARIGGPEGRLVGIAHFLLHPTYLSEAPVLYLQDLFADPEARGRGVGRALIEAGTAFARSQGCARYYWNTHETNAAARALYDRVGRNTRSMRYEVPL